jgi:hypothetical protein
MNVIYFHICCINNWRDVVQKLLNNIHESNLYDNVDEIRCVVLGKDYDDKVLQDPKMKIIYRSDDTSLYEFKIMEILYHDSQKEDFNVLYIHSKGISDIRKDPKTQENIKDWVDMMIYYMIGKYDKCLDKLQDHDVVGVNLYTHAPVHFSGNFWWSKSSHIKTLGPLVDKSYNGPEFYITSKEGGKYFSLWNSNVWHYDVAYPAENYVGKIIENFQNNCDYCNKRMLKFIMLTSVISVFVFGLIVIFMMQK